MSPRSSLTAADVSKIKRRLWNGAVPSAVATRHSVSAVSIRAIVSGYRWAAVEWPDGSLGGMSEERKKAIAEAREAAGGEAMEKAVAKILTKGESK